MFKDWLWQKIFATEVKNYYDRIQKIIMEKDLEIKNLKERIKYLNSKIEKEKLNEKYLCNQR